MSLSDRWWNRAAVLLLITVLLILVVQVPGTSEWLRPETTAAQDPDPTHTPEPEVIQLVPSPAPAIQASLWWNEQIAQRDLDLVQGMGFRWVKQSFPWREIETLERGQYDWWRPDRIVEDAEERGLFLIVRLDRQPFWSQPDGGALPLDNIPPADLQDFGNFCHAVAARYKGRIQAYQVWNEPNLSREWGQHPPNAAEYTRLLAVCYEGIKTGDPDAIVISAGPAPTGTDLPVAIPDDRFIREMYKAGAAQYFDMLGVNAPGYAAPPQLDPAVAAVTPELGGYRWMAFRHVEDIRQIMVEFGDGHKQIAILELGWTTDPIHEAYSWFRVTEEQQAEYLAGAYWYARQHWQPWIGIMTAIYLADPYWTPENEEYWWSISLPNWPDTVTRPAYDALRGLPDWSGDFYADGPDE
jgi:hypothetical protein